MKAIFYGFQFPHHGRFSAFNGFRGSLGTQGVDIVDASWPRIVDMRGFRRLRRPLMKFRERQLWARIHQQGYDLVHYFFPENSVFEAFHNCHKSQKRVLSLHLPGGNAYLSELRLDNPLLHSAIKKADGIILMAPDDLEIYREFAPNSRVVFLPHGIDTEFFAPQPASQFPVHPMRAITIGNMLRDYEFWARTVREALQICSDLEFVVIAGRNHLPKVLPIFGGTLPPQVQWLTGISDEELRIQYTQAGVLFLPLKEAWANNALLEAAAMGLPVMATDLPAIRAYLGELGIYFQNNDPQAAARELLGALANTERAQRLRLALRKRAEEQLSWDVIAAQYHNFYQLLVEG
ncbi:MAG: glycosyltransferase family 4 protein [Verrucomicrobiota bacterium]